MLIIWMGMLVLGVACVLLTVGQQPVLTLRPWRGLGALLALLGVLALTGYLPINQAFLVWLVVMASVVGWLPSLAVVLNTPKRLPS